jgi:hypothetical protein
MTDAEIKRALEQLAPLRLIIVTAPPGFTHAPDRDPPSTCWATIPSLNCPKDKKDAWTDCV